MNPEISYRFFKKLEKDHFSLIYMGEFDDALTTTLIRINENSIAEPQLFKNKLSFLIVECFQNIIRHAGKPEIITRTNNKPKMFLIRNIKNAFYIASTNLIDNTKKEGLTSKLKSINKFTTEELKAVYLDALTTNEFSDKGSNGLGLIEMARKANCKLEFDFEFVNYFLSIFYMQLKVIALNVPEKDGAGAITLDNTKELYNAMLAENILMIRKGDFSQKSILPLLELIENNLKSQRNLPASKKKTLYLLVELLQNISKHGKEYNGLREGIFIIAVKNNQYILNTGNYIDNENVESLKNKLKNLVSLDQDGLAETYKKNLFKKSNGPKGNAGIGLVEISKYSSEKIKYNFTLINENVSFVSLNIAI